MQLIHSLERRHDVGKVAIDVPVRFGRHLDGEGNAVEQLHGMLVCTALDVGVARTAYGDVAGRRYVDERRCLLGLVELLAFFLVVECHGFASLR